MLSAALGPKGPATLREEIEQICFRDGGYPSLWPRHTVCPACTSASLTRSFYKYGLSHDRCGSCGLVAVNPFPSDAIITRLYSGAYYTNNRQYFEKPMIEKGESLPFSASKDILQEIIRRATEGRNSGRWLDAGGGVGAFAHLIKEERPDWTIDLNEMNPQSIAIARDVFKLNVVELNPVDLMRGPKYNVVSSVAVLEHTPNPVDFLRSYASLVEVGGWLVVAVPHFTRLNALVSRGSSPNVVPPFHLSLFNEEALRRAIGQVPSLRIVSIDQAGPPAFRLHDHVQFGDNYDIQIATPDSPEPKTLFIEPHDAMTMDALHHLGSANEHLQEFFAETDGRLYLIAYCRRVT
jgi:SAM-dependent methyltransferase